MRFTALLPVFLLLLTSCSGSTQNAETTSTPAASQVLVVHPKVSCATLIGDEVGLVEKAAVFFNDVDGLSAEKGEEAKKISLELEEVSRTAAPELQVPIAGMRKPLDEYASTVEKGGDYQRKFEDFAIEGRKVVTICREVSASASASASPTKTGAAAGITYTLACKTAGGDIARFTDFRAAWAQPVGSCMPLEVGGTPSPEEVKANEGYTDDPLGARYLYALCASTTGHYIDGPLSPVQADEVRRALTLCPDHPKRSQLEANAR